MKDFDVILLTAFITRIEMYVGKDDKNLIITFIAGYEIGRENKCTFSVSLSKLLEDNYRCKKRAMGWPAQISEYGKKNNLNWKTSFKKIGLQVITQYLTDSCRPKFNEIFRTIISGKIKQIPPLVLEDEDKLINRFDSDWVYKWLGLVNINEKWFIETWTESQLEVISEINKEIETLNPNSDTLTPSSELLKLSDDFLKVYQEPIRTHESIFTQ